MMIVAWILSVVMLGAAFGQESEPDWRPTNIGFLARGIAEGLVIDRDVEEVPYFEK